MREHSRYNISARHAGHDTLLTRREACASPASLAAERANQLHALLLITHGAAFEQFSGFNEESQDALLALASGLAHEVLVLAELSAMPVGREGGDV